MPIGLWTAGYISIAVVSLNVMGNTTRNVITFNIACLQSCCLANSIKQFK